MMIGTDTKLTPAYHSPTDVYIPHDNGDKKDKTPEKNKHFGNGKEEKRVEKTTNTS